MYVRTYIETTERHRLDPMSNDTGSLWMPLDKRNEDCGNDEDEDDNVDDSEN